MSSSLLKYQNILILSNVKHFKNSPLCQQYINTSHLAKYSSYSQETLEKLTIPTRIKRDDVTILKALASTVKKDYNSPAFRYIDDPFLIPNSNVEKRSYTLARTAGAKAADYVLAQHPDSFVENRACPHIKEFMTKTGMQYPEDELRGLEERIECLQPILAHASYLACTEKGIEVSESLQLSLLDLLCVYNSTDPSDDLERPEELYYNREVGQDKSYLRSNKTWMDEGSAETLYASLANQNSEAMSSVIRGRVKYLDVNGAFDLYTSMKDKQMKPSIEVHNAIISILAMLNDRAEVRWQMIQDILHDISSQGLQPTLATFNNALYVMSRSQRYRQTPSWMMSLINEMKEISIEPSLATYYHLVRTCYASDTSQSDILFDIIAEIEGKEFKVRDPLDYDFFSIAMIKCFVNIKDASLARRIDKLLNTGGNVKLIGDGYKEGLYYTNYLRLLCMIEQIDTIMEEYERIIPHVYTPTFTALDELLEAVDLNEGYSYLPKIWSDIVMFDYSRRTSTVETVLGIMGKVKHEDKLQELFVNIANNIRDKFTDDLTNRRINRPMEMTGTMIGNLIMIHLHANNTLAARNILKLYKDNKNVILSFPSEASLVKYCERAVQNNDIACVLESLRLMFDFAYPRLDELAGKVLKSDLPLTEEHKNIISDLM